MNTELIEALKECEYALAQALRTNQIGWLQQSAHKTACEVLEKAKKLEATEASQKSLNT